MFLSLFWITLKFSFSSYISNLPQGFDMARSAPIVHQPTLKIGAVDAFSPKSWNKTFITTIMSTGMEGRTHFVHGKTEDYPAYRPREISSARPGGRWAGCKYKRPRYRRNEMMDWQIKSFTNLLFNCFLLTLSPTKVPPKFGDNRNGCGGKKKCNLSTFYLTMYFIFLFHLFSFFFFILHCILEGPLMARTESRDQYESARSKGGSASPNSTISSIRLTSENFLRS